jgi:hypothetical protein
MFSRVFENLTHEILSVLNMNAVEIEEAVSELAVRPFDRDEFPYAFLTAFGNKETTVRRLRSGQSNASDVASGVLQRNNIHIAVCDEGAVGSTVVNLRQSPKTLSAKAKFILATDGVTLEAEDLTTGEVLASPYSQFAEHFGFFLPLAGISTVKEIKNNPIDVKATGRLNKLYVELLKDNPEWATEKKRPALNQFMARLIFCFFAEDTGIFRERQFTRTIDQMSDSRGRVEKGKSGGGNSFGYSIVKRVDESGEYARGERCINEEEAAIVRQIFTDYAGGISPRAISTALNRQGVSADRRRMGRKHDLWQPRARHRYSQQ